MADVIIRRQKISVHADSEKLAFDCRRQLNETANDELIKLYERIFHQETESADYITIKSLKLELGVISKGDFDQNFYKLVEDKLLNELKMQFEASPAPSSSAMVSNNDRPESPRSSEINYAGKNQQEVTALICFFETGTFPWWYKKSLEKSPSKVLEDFNDNERQSIVLKVYSKAKSLSGAVSENLVTRFFNSLTNETIAEEYFRQLKALFSDQAIQTNIDVLIHQRTELASLFNISVKSFLRSAFHFVLLKHESTGFFREFLKQLSVIYSASSAELLKRAKSLGIDKQLFPENFFHESLAVAKNVENELQTKRSTNKTLQEKQIIEEGIYIGNAGLVLFHPFLPSFFQTLNLLTEQDQFVSADAQLKAAVLLYYLQSCDEDYKEWEMPFNKVFCGINATDIIPENIKLSEPDKDESKKLLQTVVDYWEALKGSSVEALQHAFVQREGKITFKDNFWLLQVERTGVDILLERLPWGFGTIKLPWLKEIIYTEW